MRLRSVSATLACLLCFLLLGCGANAPTGSGGTSMPAGSTLAGNWLLGPSLPNLGNPAVSTAAVSFDVSGQTITATGDFEAACTGLVYSLQFGAAFTGTVQADGTFTLTYSSPTNGPVGSNPVSVTLSGKAPSAAGSPWAGTYTITPSNTLSCTAAQLTSSFSAKPMGDFTGLYTGMGTYQMPFGSMASGSTSLSLTLQQGAPIGSSTTVSRIGLTGSLAITGIPCFTKSIGAPTLNHSLIEGSRGVLALVMDDGSEADLLFEAKTVSLSSLGVDSLFVTSGKCAGQYLFFPNQLILTRQ